MKKLFLLLPALLALSAPAEVPVAPGATVEKLSGGLKFTEGPAADSHGNVAFTDIPRNLILVWSVDGKLSTLRENSGGANGLWYDAQDRLLVCEGGNRRLTRTATDGTVEVLADQFEGKKFNSPNDLWPDPKGGVYFTDPRYGKTDDVEMSVRGVYHVDAAGKVRRVLDDLKNPNGVIGTPDGKVLYVGDNGGGITYKYDIQPDGTLAGRVEFAKGHADGFTLDDKGNLYLTHEGVDVVAPDGTCLGRIEVPERPANVTFGGPANDELFITARTGLYRVRMAVKGAY